MAGPDACVARGSADGQSKAGDLANCVSMMSCTDAPCVQMKCAPSLDACVTSSAPPAAGTPLEGSAPPGNVPAELVVSYARANFGATTRVTLLADGTGTYQTAISSLTTGCTSTSSTSQTGTAVVTADTITIYATASTTTQKECSAPSTSLKGPGKKVDLTYTHPDSNTLNIVDATSPFNSRRQASARASKRARRCSTPPRSWASTSPSTAGPGSAASARRSW